MLIYIPLTLNKVPYCVFVNIDLILKVYIRIYLCVLFYKFYIGALYRGCINIF